MSLNMASTDDKASEDSKSPLEIDFQPDVSSKKRKGFHRPIPAEVFTKSKVEGERPSKIYLLVNPYSGKKKGSRVAEEAKKIFESKIASVRWVRSLDA